MRQFSASSIPKAPAECARRGGRAELGSFWRNLLQRVVLVGLPSRPRISGLTASAVK